jgi:hypothetical protein
MRASLRSTAIVCLIAGLVSGAHARQAAAQAVAEEARAFAIASGGFSLEAPAGWQRVQPKSGIVETEFSIPSEGEGLQPGRMTVMGAGGSVQANVDRW